MSVVVAETLLVEEAQDDTMGRHRQPQLSSPPVQRWRFR
jgi:hypothetical protein